MNDARIEQIRLNALTAKNSHARRLSRLRGLNTLYLSISFLVPIFYVVPTYILKGSDLESSAGYVGFALNILLLGIAIFYVISKVDDKILQHRRLMQENIYVANEALEFLSNNRAETERSWFFRYVSRVDDEDKAAVAAWSEDERQLLYREALKELYPGDTTVVCPVCKASPFKFLKGSCQTCGNTPV